MKLNVIGKDLVTVIKSFDLPDMYVVDRISLVRAATLDPDFLKATGRYECYDFTGVEVPVSKNGFYLAIMYGDRRSFKTYLFNPNHCRMEFGD